ncbi:MAG: DUF3842 family protein [Faecalibacterium sp.]|jgi:hypothetical protein|nr:DUF3842 family protein [Faecalibacterium sp.]
MNVVVIDGQGGRLGRELIAAVSARCPAAEVTAVGASSAATAQMMKASPAHAATGENAVLVACRRADVILGPIGIVIADAMLGEITPKMAQAVGQSAAVRILVPLNRCDNIVAGVSDVPLSQLVDDAAKRLAALDE